jgi:two-component system sensor histidine kinase KdpD
MQTENIEALKTLLGDARTEADRLRVRLNKFEQIILSTRLIMGHELKKPTTAISGYLDLALEDLREERTEAVEENVEKARGECSLLIELNAFFLELVKVNNSDETLYSTKVDLHSFVKETIVHLPVVLNAHERVKTRLSPQIRDFQLNRNAFKMILSNIIENALKYSPADTEVVVDVRKIPDKRGMQNREILQIKVHDSGVGIPAREVKRIFSPFVRLHEEIADGIGLGLTLVRSLVELYGGDVHIKSLPEGPTTVFVTIPESTNHGETRDEK